MDLFESESSNGARSFLRWPGSKKWLLNSLDVFLPGQFNNYHEPFLGSGSVFFHIQDNKRFFYLSDLNGRLINCYTQIKENHSEVILFLKKFKNTQKEYLKIKNLPPQDEIFEAAKFIYLNRTCFNGIYRVNSKGEFNVPYGHRKNLDIVTEDLFNAVSSSLSNAKLGSFSFEKSLKNIEAGDLVFLDPPYIHPNSKDSFVAYNEKLFSWEDQKRLKNYILELKSLGAFYIMTNAYDSSIVDLYKPLGKPSVVKRLSRIGGVGAFRGDVKEVIFTNCK